MEGRKGKYFSFKSKQKRKKESWKRKKHDKKIFILILNNAWQLNIITGKIHKICYKRALNNIYSEIENIHRGI